MSEFMMQVAMKLEISGEEGVLWDTNDVANVLRESLSKLHNRDEEDNTALYIQICYLSEYIKQTKPMISTERIASYFHRDGARHWMYLGNTDAHGIPTRYEAASVLSPTVDITGVVNLCHSITAKEGEFKVVGHVKYSTLKGTKHALQKLTIPDELKENVLGLNTEATTIKPLVPRARKNKHEPLLKKRVSQMKKSNPKKSSMASFLKILAPGAGSLLLGNDEGQHGRRLEGREDMSEDSMEGGEGEFNKI